MSESPQGTVTDLACLPPVGTPQRREWDRTIREANELYPDWASIGIGRGRFLRETYERDYKQYYTRPNRPGRTAPRRPKLAAPRPLAAGR